MATASQVAAAQGVNATTTANIQAAQQAGATQDATVAANLSTYPTYPNSGGVGSQSAGATMAQSAPTSTPLIGSSPGVGDQNSNPITGSMSYNPWDLKGQANSRLF